MVDKGTHMLGLLSGFASDEAKMPGEYGAKGETSHLSLMSIQRQDTTGDHAHAQAKGDEIDDEVEVVDLHHGLDVQTVVD